MDGLFQQNHHRDHQHDYDRTTSCKDKNVYGGTCAGSSSRSAISRRRLKVCLILGIGCLSTGGIFESSQFLSASRYAWDVASGHIVPQEVQQQHWASVSNRTPTAVDFDRWNEQRLFNLLQQDQEKSKSKTQLDEQIFKRLSRLNLLPQDQKLPESESQLDEQTLKQLSQDLWKKIRPLYYRDDSGSDSNTTQENSSFGEFPNGPLILGMERCPDFRNQWGSNGTIAVASLFNSGSNAMTKNLQLNLAMPGSNRSFYWHDELYSHGVWSQVPWWKHNPIISDQVIGRKSDSTEHASVLPIVIVRDFYFWRKSTCQTPYSISWQKKYSTPASRCPGIGYRNTTSLKANHSRVADTDQITFHLDDGRIPRSGIRLYYPSLVQLWNSFYKQYLDAPFPRLIIRFEDILFYLPKIIQSIHDCAGANWKSPEDLSEKDRQGTMVWSEEGQRSVVVYRDVAKSHGDTRRNSKLSVLAATIEAAANPSLRTSQMNELERDYTRRMLDPSLMELFHYTYPSST